MKSYVNFVIKYQITLRVIMFIITIFALIYYFSDSSKSENHPINNTTTTTIEGFLPNSVLIAAVGDISCSTRMRQEARLPCEDEKVAQLIKSKNPDHLLLLGDIQYKNGNIDDFNRNFVPIWKDLLPIAKPTPGNHDYHSTGANGYYQTFPDYPKPGYYSFDINDRWHVVSINTNYECKYVWCTKNSDQYEWLKKDLQLNNNKCVIAMTHYPYYSSRLAANLGKLEPMYNLMDKHDVVFLLSGHEHIYERLNSPVPQYVVGTGGQAYSRVRSFRHQYSQHFIGYTSGSMFIELNGNIAKTYFVSLDGKVHDTYYHKCTK